MRLHMKKILMSILLLLGMTLPSYAVVSSTINQNEYACNSSNTQWNYTFPIILSTDIYVYTIDSSGNSTPQPTNFSVNTTTQTVTYPVSGTPCATGYNLLLQRIEPFTQQVAASNQGPAPSPVVMTMSDKLTMLAQQLNNNGVQSAPGTSGVITLPPYIAGDLFAWSSTPNLIANVTNPSAVAQWSLSGANISYNVGNVSTTNNMSANEFVGLLNGNINWPAVGNLLTHSNVNWNDFNMNALLNAGGVNWPNLNSNILNKAINWTSIPNYAGVNWSMLVANSTTGVNWIDMKGIQPINGLLSATNVGALVGTPITGLTIGTSGSPSIYGPAATDGIVQAWATTNTNFNLIGYTDATTTPSTIGQQGGSSGEYVVPITFFVKKGNYYQVQYSAGTLASSGMSFTPIGS